MIDLKNDRIRMIFNSLQELENIKTLYKDAYPAWILINSAQGFIRSLHYLESETKLDGETLGVRFNDE